MPARTAIEDALKAQGVPFKRSYVDDGRMMVLFDDVDAQLAARDAVNDDLQRTPMFRRWRAPRARRRSSASIGLRPMPLGLDLRGGLYLLYQVDVNGAVDQLLDSYEQDYRRALTADEDRLHRCDPVADDERHRQRRARHLRAGRRSRTRRAMPCRRSSPTSPTRSASGACPLRRCRADRRAGRRAQAQRHPAEHGHAAQPRRRAGRDRARWCSSRAWTGSRCSCPAC